MAMRTRNPYSGLPSSRRSIYYYSNEHDPDDALYQEYRDTFNAVNSSFLIKDVGSAVLRRGLQRTVRVSLQPSDQRVEDLIAHAINRIEHVPRFDEAVVHFFEDCATHVMAFQEAIYEIVYFVQPATGKTVGFRLEFIQPWTIRRRRGKLWQRVPHTVAQAHGRADEIDLAPDALLTFTPPSYVAGKLRHMIDDLWSTHEQVIPAFAFPDNDAGVRTVPFDMTAYLRAMDVARADAGKLIGWNERGLFDKRMLGYYQVYRQIAFVEFLLKLRTSIQATLNEGLRRAGSVIGFSGEIVIDGAPTLHAVETAREHLASGDMPLHEILTPLRGW